mmetsp:Transcript_6896/g.10188  ORF Transcript_6896/g.10188 Transcript_6896/m.10188 type:complete len:519 (-) Transcript_6896:378-1934(-)
MACIGANRLPQHDSSPFPLKLMEILDHNRHGDIICWLPHGRGFIIRDKKRFEIEVMPHYFKESKYTSFTRRLNRWNFTIQAHGHKKASYFHPIFVRGNPIQCLDMKPVSQVRKNTSWSALGSSNASIAAAAAADDGQHEEDISNASGTPASKNKNIQAIESETKLDASSYQKEKIKIQKPNQSARSLFSHQPHTSRNALLQAPNIPRSQEQQFDQIVNSNNDLDLNRAILMSQQARKQQLQHSRDVTNPTGLIGAQQARHHQLQQFQDLTHPISLQGPESLLNSSRYPNMMQLMQQNLPTGPSPFNPNMGFRRYDLHNPSSLLQRGLVPASLPNSSGHTLNNDDSNIPAIPQQLSRQEMPGFSGTVSGSGAGWGQFPYSYANVPNLAMFPPAQLNIASNSSGQHLLASLQQNQHQQRLMQSNPLHRQEVYRQAGMTNLSNTPLEQGMLQSTHPQRTVDQYKTATTVVGDGKDTGKLNNLPQESRSSLELPNAGQWRHNDREGRKSQEKHTQRDQHKKA